MPVFINEIVIKTNVESTNNSGKTVEKNDGNLTVEEVVKQAVDKVFEILEFKKER